MDAALLISGIVQIALSIILGTLFIFSAFRIFSRRIKSINEIEELQKNNIAIAIFNGSILISVVIMIKSAIEPAILTFSNNLRNPSASVSTYFQTAMIMLLQIIVAAVLAFITIYVALNLFMWLTKELDELTEISKNNIAVSILLAFVVISFALIMQQGIRTVIDSLIPFPAISLKDIGY